MSSIQRMYMKRDEHTEDAGTRKIADQLQIAKEEARILEAEAKGAADNLKRLQEEKHAQLVSNEIKKRADMQIQREAEGRFENNFKLRMVEKAKGAVNETPTRNIEEEVRRRAVTEAQRIMEERRRTAQAAAFEDQRIENEIQRRAEEEAQRIVAAQEADISLKLAYQQRKSLEEDERKLRVEEAVNKRVEEESLRIQDALRKRQEDDKHRAMTIADKVLLIEQDVQQRVAKSFNPHLAREVNPSPSFSSPIGPVPVSPRTPSSTIQTENPSWASEHDVRASYHASPAHSVNVAPAPPIFTIVEVSAPPGPLGLVLYPFTIQIAVMAKTSAIYCSVVTESKTTGAIKRGDLLMSVGNFTLLADEQQSPGGQNHVDACARVVSQAPHPRKIRLYRSSSINPDSGTVILPAEEASEIAPMIFSSGDGSQRLMAALAELKTGGFSGMPRGSSSAAEETLGNLSAGRRLSDGDALGAQRTDMSPIAPINVPPARRRDGEDSADASSGHPCRIFEQIFREKGGLGLVLTAISLTLEASPGVFECFWAMMVMDRGGFTNIRPGDIVLFCNTFSCVVNRNQARSSLEFAAIMREAVASASIPRTLRFARCLDVYVDATLNPAEHQWRVSAAESASICALIFRDGDQGRYFSHKASSVVRDLDAADPAARRQREIFQKNEGAYLSRVDANRPQITLGYVDSYLIPSTRSRDGSGGSDGGGGRAPTPKSDMDESDPAKARMQRRKELRDKWKTSQDAQDCRIFEVMYHDKTSTGLIIEPYCVTLETLPGQKQSFWCGLVTGGKLGDRVKVGDIVLYVNTHMCMIDRSQARNGYEFSRAVKEVILSASVPRAIRFARCGSINIKDDPLSVYVLNAGEGKTVCNVIFSEGDNGLFMLSKVRSVVQKVEMEEGSNPSKMTERLAFEKKSERQYQIDLREQMGESERGRTNFDVQLESAVGARKETETRAFPTMAGGIEDSLEGMQRKTTEVLRMNEQIKLLQAQLNGIQSRQAQIVAQPLFVPQRAPADALRGGLNSNSLGATFGGGGVGAGTSQGMGMGNAVGSGIGSAMGNMGRSPLAPRMPDLPESGALIYQIVYGAAGSMGIHFAPLTLGYVASQGHYQILHVAVVTTNNGGSSIRPGDIILSVNGLSLVGSSADTMGGDAFMQSVIGRLTTQAPPKVMRYFRCPSMDITDVQTNPYPLPMALSEADAVVLLEG